MEFVGGYEIREIVFAFSACVYIYIERDRNKSAVSRSSSSFVPGEKRGEDEALDDQKRIIGGSPVRVP